MKTKTVTVYVTYELGGKLVMEFPANQDLQECITAIEVQLENEGLIEDAVNFKCTHRELSVAICNIRSES